MFQIKNEFNSAKEGYINRIGPEAIVKLYILKRLHACSRHLISKGGLLRYSYCNNWGPNYNFPFKTVSKIQEQIYTVLINFD